MSDSSPPKVVLSSAADITAALADDRLIPPSVDGTGSTLALRSAMARFSAPDNHGALRTDVEQAIARIDLTTVASRAAQLTIERLHGAVADGSRLEVITGIGRPVAVGAIASVLGVDAELGGVIADVDAVVAVIGRGQPSSAQSDEAVDRLMMRFAVHPDGPVAAISALYQSMDATAALIATRLINRSRNEPAAVPIARTIRVGATGAVIELELGTAGLWFGAGPHACPGRELAETIADAIVAAVDAHGVVLDEAAIELDRDQRPIAAWIVARS